jgi:hypothetical protein
MRIHTRYFTGITTYISYYYLRATLAVAQNGGLYFSFGCSPKLTSLSQIGISLHLHGNDTPWIGCKHKEFVPKANPCAWTTLTVPVPYVAIPATRFRIDKSSISVNGHMHMWLAFQ